MHSSSTQHVLQGPCKSALAEAHPPVTLRQLQQHQYWKRASRWPTCSSLLAGRAWLVCTDRWLPIEGAGIRLEL